MRSDSGAAIALACPPQLVGKRLLLAYSGGLDSSVLLHLLATAGLPLRAVHVDHGLQAASPQWAEHCAAQAKRCGVALRLLRLADIDPRPLGPEAAAREARYRALLDELCDDEVLVTAHHQQDQAETLLLAALRGSGAAGLSGMPVLYRRGAHWHWRPLLDHSRSALLRYAEWHGVQWIDDPHNSDLRFRRSNLRSRVMPLLEAMAPGASAQLARSAALLAEQTALMQRYLDAELQRRARDCPRWPGHWRALAVDAELGADAPRLRALLHRWLGAHCGLPPPRHALLQRVAGELLTARADATPLLRWPGGELRRFGDLLCASSGLASCTPIAEQLWSGAQPLALGVGLGRLCAALPLPSGAALRWAWPGLRFRARGDAHHRGLKALMQARGIPPWLRPLTPVVVLDGEPQWLGHVGVAACSANEFSGLRWLLPAAEAVPAAAEEGELDAATLAKLR